MGWRLDREVRKIIVECWEASLANQDRILGQAVYCSNPDNKDENACRKAELGHQSLIKDATKYAKELKLDLNLGFPDPSCCAENGVEVQGRKI